MTLQSLPRNTNTCPLNGSSANADPTLAASPLKPTRMSVNPAAIHTGLCPPAAPSCPQARHDQVQRVGTDRAGDAHNCANDFDCNTTMLAWRH